MIRAAVLLWTVAFASCCSYRVDLRQFDGLTLEKKISAFERGAGSGCLAQKRIRMLDRIADHGKPAADAMIPLLNGSSTTFHVIDAITVIRLIHARGHDIRDHVSIGIVRGLAESAADVTIRTEAREAMAQIEQGAEVSRLAK